jgi:hypothetical protein
MVPMIMPKLYNQSDVLYVFRGDDRSTLSVKTDSESHAFYKAIRFFDGQPFRLVLKE